MHICEQALMLHVQVGQGGEPTKLGWERIIKLLLIEPPARGDYDRTTNSRGRRAQVRPRKQTLARPQFKSALVRVLHVQATRARKFESRKLAKLGRDAGREQILHKAPASERWAEWAR